MVSTESPQLPEVNMQSLHDMITISENEQKAGMNWFKAKILRNASQDRIDVTAVNELDKGKENLNADSAAVIIQSRKYPLVGLGLNSSGTVVTCVLYTDFRGFTIRRRFGYELEERFKRILNNYDNKQDGLQALLREGLRNADAAFIVQRWYRKEEIVKKKKYVPPQRDTVHSKLRQADLIAFSQNVSFLV